MVFDTYHPYPKTYTTNFLQIQVSCIMGYGHKYAI